MADNPQHCDQDGDGHFGQAHRHAWNEEQVGDDQALYDDQGRILSATPLSQGHPDRWAQVWLPTHTLFTMFASCLTQLSGLLSVELKMMPL